VAADGGGGGGVGHCWGEQAIAVVGWKSGQRVLQVEQTLMRSRGGEAA